MANDFGNVSIQETNHIALKLMKMCVSVSMKPSRLEAFLSSGSLSLSPCNMILKILGEGSAWMLQVVFLGRMDQGAEMGDRSEPADVVLESPFIVSPSRASLRE